MMILRRIFYETFLGTRGQKKCLMEVRWVSMMPTLWQRLSPALMRICPAVKLSPNSLMQNFISASAPYFCPSSHREERFCLCLVLCCPLPRHRSSDLPNCLQLPSLIPSSVLVQNSLSLKLMWKSWEIQQQKFQLNSRKLNGPIIFHATCRVLHVLLLGGKWKPIQINYPQYSWREY